MSFKKVIKEKCKPRDVEDVQIGDIITCCTCLTNEKIEHLTDSYDGETCIYCGFFILEKKATKKDERIMNCPDHVQKMKEAKLKRKHFLNKERLHDVKLH